MRTSPPHRGSRCSPQQCRPPTDGAADLGSWDHKSALGATAHFLRRPHEQVVASLYVGDPLPKRIRCGLAAVLAGRLPLDHGVRTQLGEMLGVDWVDNGTAFTSKNRPPPPPSIGRTHIFHSESMVCQLSRESRAQLAKAYWADYELQGLQTLPRDIEVACRE